MPRFHFHVRHTSTGKLDIDEEGLILPDSDAAKSEALESAKELIIEQIRTCRCIDSQFEVVDAHGELVFVMPFREAIGL